jgi:hypothetical protein
MVDRTFEQIAQEVRTSAEQASLPSDGTANAIDLIRAPCSSAETTYKAVRCSLALAGDPAGNLTPAELSGHFQKAVKDWERAQKVLEAASTPNLEHLARTADLTRQGDWQIIRSRVETGLEAAGGLNAAHGAPTRLLKALDDHIALAKAGKVQEAFAETARNAAEANRIFADVYAQLAGGADLKQRHWDDCWDTVYTGVGAVAAAVATGYCYSQARVANVPVNRAVFFTACASIGLVTTTFCSGYCVSSYFVHH